MKYTPRKIPEGINTSTEHPLKEFSVLLVGAVGLVLALLLMVTLLTDVLVRLIPVEYERQWIVEQLPASDTTAASEAEQELLDYLGSVVESLKDRERPEFQFSVRMMASDEPNAFALPGGYVYVTRGLLRTVTSENALAMVLAHEMAHQYHRDPIRAFGRGVVIMLALAAIAGTDGGIAASFLGDATMLGQLAYSREQETSADELGVALLVRHYGHAGGASEFFHAVDEMQSNVEEVAPDFLKTHPGTESRIKFLESLPGATNSTLVPLDPAVASYLATSE
ncbi:MAG: M48 family metallopeptidase [bacterium]